MTTRSSLLRLAGAAVATLALVSCGGGSSSSNWTYAPGVATATPAASGSPPASPAASGSPAAGGSPGASGSPGGSGPVGSGQPGGSGLSPAPTADMSSSSPGSGGSPGISPQAPGSQLTLTAQNVKFDTDQLAAPADTAFQILFENREAVPHNVSIYDTPQMGQTFLKGEWLNAQGSITYNVPALKAGTYTFLCDVHPQIMVGTLTIR